MSLEVFQSLTSSCLSNFISQISGLGHAKLLVEVQSCYSVLPCPVFLNVTWIALFPVFFLCNAYFAIMSLVLVILLLTEFERPK